MPPTALGNDGQKLTGRLFLDQGNAADHSKEFPRGRLDVHFSEVINLFASCQISNHDIDLK